MLVLTRKPQSSIRIGDDVVIRVIRTARGSVRIGIEAPAHVRVRRGELASRDEQHADFHEASAAEAVLLQH